MLSRKRFIGIMVEIIAFSLLFVFVPGTNGTQPQLDKPISLGQLETSGGQQSFQLIESVLESKLNAFTNALDNTTLQQITLQFVHRAIDKLLNQDETLLQHDVDSLLKLLSLEQRGSLIEPLDQFDLALSEATELNGSECSLWRAKTLSSLENKTKKSPKLNQLMRWKLAQFDENCDSQLEKYFDNYVEENGDLDRRINEAIETLSKHANISSTQPKYDNWKRVELMSELKSIFVPLNGTEFENLKRLKMDNNKLSSTISVAQFCSVFLNKFKPIFVELAKSAGARKWSLFWSFCDYLI